MAFTIAAFGNGVLEAAWNAWVGNLAQANELLGILHGVYALSAAARYGNGLVVMTESMLMNKQPIDCDCHDNASASAVVLFLLCDGQHTTIYSF